MPHAPLRLALISLHTSPLAEAGSGDAGGMNIMVRHTADALADAGHQVTVFTRRADPDSPESVDLPSGVRVRRLSAGPAAPADKRAHEDFIAPFAEQLERHWEIPDLVHSHHWFSGMAAQPLAAKHGIPHVQSFHSIAADERRPLAEGEPPEGPGRRSGEAHLAQHSEAILAVSHAEATTAIERLAAPAHCVHVVPPGVDVHTFRPRTGRAAPHLVVAARLEPLKGIDLAIRALALLPHGLRIPLSVYGAPSGAYPQYARELHELAHGLGVGQEVQFYGAVSREGLAEAFGSASAVLVPSHSETYGLTALEAAACGVPVLASGAGGLSESVHDGQTGLLIPSRDPQEWAGAIRRVVADPAYAHKLGAHGRELALERTWKATASGWEKLYRTLIS